ncbi:hypothetical protein [Marinicella sp. W31]|uniref:hypothetical protein n=1 Tax=Marinicella sp. W31 TaxID=3023713 RepID=UPI003756E385
MKKNTRLFSLAMGMCILGQSATAANLNPRGTGQVLIYPYYTVNNDLNTLYSVVNTTADVKAVKVRFLEGDNGQEVLDFNVYLSPFDVWTAALSASATGTDHFHVDTSCAPFLTTPQSFLNFAFVLDPGSDDEERVRDGHFEILEMGNITDPLLAAEATHVNGVPANCNALAAAWSANGQWDIDPNDGLTPPTGGLFGHAIIIDVAEGTAISYRADTIDDFYQQDVVSHAQPGEFSPNLSSAKPQSVLIDSGEAIVSNWTTGEDAISALFLHKKIFNEYALDSGINARTEWVITFPTKRFYVNGTSIRAPFNALFDGPDGACEEYDYIVSNREAEIISESLLPPITPPRPPTFMCWNTNVFSLFNPLSNGGNSPVSSVLGSLNNYDLSTSPFSAGTIEMNFPEPASMVDNDNTTYEGYPVTGFALQAYTNANAQPGLLAQYATLFNHKYSRTINQKTE